MVYRLTNRRLDVSFETRSERVKLIATKLGFTLDYVHVVDGRRFHPWSS